ncbi:hypothetical protein BLNAU_21447 [Blattamonas nauphoetae]|uniref:Uncharacterized protein n=1 Tax=Blattamonas nauphoetae TaxID=2049346 RepID=A0ABQ9WYX2_9EUKA|nr:hypothetical protein BLNAU_21447 [Blattamonas nauphoetae]
MPIARSQHSPTSSFTLYNPDALHRSPHSLSSPICEYNDKNVEREIQADEGHRTDQPTHQPNIISVDCSPDKMTHRQLIAPSPSASPIGDDCMLVHRQDNIHSTFLVGLVLHFCDKAKTDGGIVVDA